MDAKALAADIRKAARTATKTSGDALHGLTVSVTAPEWGTVRVAVTGIAVTDLEIPEDTRVPGRTWATDRCRDISDRLHQLAAPAIAEADGHLTFCQIAIAGRGAPTPRQWEMPRTDAAVKIARPVTGPGTGWAEWDDATRRPQLTVVS